MDNVNGLAVCSGNSGTSSKYHHMPIGSFDDTKLERDNPMSAGLAKLLERYQITQVSWSRSYVPLSC